MPRSQDEARLPEVRAAFSSPFWPFVLAATSVGQEGIDFHWWCHSVVHWNLPANPVDFEQREDRVDRYKGHAILKNVAAAHGSAALARGVADPWTAVFEAAAAEDDHGLGDLNPFWIYPGDAQLQRRIMALPLTLEPRFGAMGPVAGVAGALSAGVRSAEAGGHAGRTAAWRHRRAAGADG